MGCLHPLTGYWSRDVGASGKRAVTFNRNGAFSPVPISIPCQRCQGCRLERSKNWAARCMHEKLSHADNCFITLTYDDDNLPSDGSLIKRDLQLFNKRLRKWCVKHRGSSFRFYACGEYGDTYGRPHYHSICFNCDFPDKRFYKYNARSEPLYTSVILDNIWGLGITTVGDVTFDSCAYVARYCMDVISGDMAADWYQGRLPEFSNMSRRPGIGAAWFAKYGRHAYEHDSVVVEGREMRPPRYYDSQFELVDPTRMAAIKKVRSRRAHKRLKENTPERRRVRATVLRARLSRGRRDAS